MPSTGSKNRKPQEAHQENGGNNDDDNMSMSSSDEEDNGGESKQVESVRRRNNKNNKSNTDELYPPSSSNRTKNPQGHARKTRKQEPLQTEKQRLGKRRDLSTRFKQPKKLIIKYKKNVVQPKVKKSQEVIEIFDDDKESSSATKEKHKKKKYSIQETDDVTDDYKDLYEEMDGDNLVLPPLAKNKRKRNSSPLLHSETNCTRSSSKRRFRIGQYDHVDPK